MSTTPDEQQRQREQQEIERSRTAAINADARLRGQGKLASTVAGRALFLEHAERVTIALGLLLEELVANPHKPGPHFAAWPLLLTVGNRGPRSLAALALGVVVDALGTEQPHDKLAAAIGKVLRDELRAGRVEKRNADLLRLVRRVKGPAALADTRTLKTLNLDPSSWTTTEQREVGSLLLLVICRGTDLIELATVLRRGKPHQVVRPTTSALMLLASKPPLPLSVRRFPMVMPPRPWERMHGGGHLDNNDPLVRSRAGLDLSYLTSDAMAPVLRTVNALQAQELRVDPAMVRLQREAWDYNIRGLFPVTRDPLPPPPRPTNGDAAELTAWRRARQAANDDRRSGVAVRKRIEEAICQCETVAGVPVWFSYCADFRGRVYSSNRYATHQGPDWEKAAIELGHGDQCSVEAFEWLLKAAAGHWGLRATWQARLQWGRENLPRMIAAAEAPLDRLELWREAKDPWQFLQLCRAIAAQVADPSTPCATPIRFDQCCSGAAIAAALVRDRKLARLTNLIGSTPHDLYGHVAERVVHALRLDLSNGLAHEKGHAERWLRLGIDRALLKAPCMTSLYGATYVGLVDTLTASLRERDPRMLGEWEQGYVFPARYMAKKLKVILSEELAGATAINTWLRDTSCRVLGKNRPLQWTTPSGMTMRLGNVYDARSNVHTLMRGTKRWRAWNDVALPGELSARATNRALAPNVIHSFDAAFLHGIVCSSVATGRPLLTNHDCFATIPRDAGWLHHTLHDHLRAMYLPEWLTIMRDEIADAAGGLQIKPPPNVGDLGPAEIGNNPHAFS